VVIDRDFIKNRLAACFHSAAEAAESSVAAAVLVPLLDRSSGLSVMLTLRPEHLEYHPGQISFPGGRAEGNESSIETALREAHEEIGLETRHAEILGTLPHYTTLTGYHITPVVALIDPEFKPRSDPTEVAEVFEVPLEHFLDAANHQRHRAFYQGSERQYYAMPYQSRFIWGATAGMLHELYRILMSKDKEESEC
jgi:8-oxo-dGTP pyrophosphatase MutT (NUDIX family)